MSTKSLCAIAVALQLAMPSVRAIQPTHEDTSEKKPDPARAELEALVQTLSVLLDRRIEEARVRYENRRRELADYMAQQEILHEGGHSFAIDVEKLRKQALDITLELDGKRALFEAMERGVPETLPITPDIQDALAADPKITRLEQQLLKADEDVSASLAKAGKRADDSDVRAVRAARETIEEQISAESASRLIVLQARKIESCRKEFLVAQEQLLKTKERLMTAEQELREQDLKHWNYERIKENCDRDKQAYESLLNQKEAFVRIPLMIDLAAGLKKSAPVRQNGLDIELSLDIANPTQSPELTVRLPRETTPNQH